ncbi:FAD-dependent oxidoreductase [Crateriforma conspicua]|uniref:Putative FAD-binding dehydrogenase n=1 Tax=Crateriforma conspicua TaxID=2527996 RepID=A0A5C6G0C3_9PLAN|nr:FAD-dependent oxidoreductase [Crateriforma conspicua]TWU67335.1 putative FAD-binding dehydrogenase [Crateriforma conspicua]
MITDGPVAETRSPLVKQIQTDLVVVGGGLAGVCAAITAARAGIQVVLIQDRPVLGGNASSEVRLWALGATSHMGNNNRWAREGGVIDEIFVENTYRNRDGNPLILDTILLEKVVEQPNITLLLNTAAFEVTKSDPDTIQSVRAFCSQNSTMYEVSSRLFCDASGDGIVGFMSGAAFRMGAETKEEFGEQFAPDESYGQLLGHSIYFYTKDTGRPVRFVPPSFAIKDITAIPRWRNFAVGQDGCRLWWIEYGGRLDTVHETETIKWELWKIVYGVWDYMKNSGKFPEAETLTLEWVGQIPGKRESRRFEGDTMMIQQDVIEQRRCDDAVSFGGWAVDLHPSDGVYSDLPGCNQWHSKGVYPIPFRAMYSRNIRNLFLAGRIISASHLAFGSTRVMATCAHNAQAVGMAAAICHRDNLVPRDLLDGDRMRGLQKELLRTGQHIPRVQIDDEDDLATKATVSASSELQLQSFPAGDDSIPMESPIGMLLPIVPGKLPRFQFHLDAKAATEIHIELRGCTREDSFTPDEVLASRNVPVDAGRLSVEVDFDIAIASQRYLFVCLMANPKVAVSLSDHRMTGVLSVHHTLERKVSNSAVQDPPDDIGVERFEFWLPQRRPAGKNLAMQITPPLSGFGPGNVITGPERPTSGINAWVASPDDSSPSLNLTWDHPVTIRRVVVALDTDLDHPMETVLMGHPESRMPFCAANIRVTDDSGRCLAEVSDNHQTRCELTFPATQTRGLKIEVSGTDNGIPVSVFRVRVFE